MNLSIKIKEVKPIGDMLLSVKFENGVSKKYDVRQLLPAYPIGVRALGERKLKIPEPNPQTRWLTRL